MFLFKDVSEPAREINRRFVCSAGGLKEIALAAQLCVLAAVLQSAGGFYPGLGYLISAMSTAPVAMASVFSPRCGLKTYLAAFLLLFFLQPGELVIFAFTTGPLGLGIGIALLVMRKRLMVVVSASLVLLSGILVLLYGLKFPILGPAAGRFDDLYWIYPFCVIYTWLWVEAVHLFLARYKKIFLPRCYSD